MQVANKVAIITGSAKGLGKAFAGALLQRGGRVCLCDVEAKLLQTTHEELASIYGSDKVYSIPCDVTSEAQMKDVFSKAKKEMNGLDIMVNNAGIANEKAWEKTVDINLTGMMRGTLLAMDAMKPGNGGSGGTIVNVASMAGIVPVAHAPAYSASKHGIVAYTRSWAMNPDSAANNIRLVCLCPTYADTDIIKAGNETIHGPELLQESLDKLGVMSVDTVVEAFLKLLDDGDNHGNALAVSKQRGMKYCFGEGGKASQL